MTTTDIESAARAGYETYFGNRRTWDRDRPNVQKHWLDAAARVLNGEVTNGRHLRAAYLVDWASLAWQELRRHDRNLWSEVLAAMRSAATTEAAA